MSSTPVQAQCLEPTGEFEHVAQSESLVDVSNVVADRHGEEAHKMNIIIYSAFLFILNLVIHLPEHADRKDLS